VLWPVVLARYLYFLGRDETGILSNIKMESNYINIFKSYQKQAVIWRNVIGVILKLKRGRKEILIPEFYVRTVA
jgi:hypothetical protein